MGIVYGNHKAGHEWIDGLALLLEDVQALESSIKQGVDLGEYVVNVGKKAVRRVRGGVD